MKSGPLRDRTISVAVTQKMYDTIKNKAKQLNMTPSAMSYDIFYDFFEEELEEQIPFK